jgi:hypothetical protein
MVVRLSGYPQQYARVYQKYCRDPSDVYSASELTILRIRQHVVDVDTFSKILAGIDS